MLKRSFVLTVMFLMITVTAIGKVEITRFLGIPVDGPKDEMVMNLKAKGYTYNSDEDYFTGYYFGHPVYLFIQTNNEKVSRIILYDVIQRNEEEIKYRFNDIYTQFITSDRYERMNKRDKSLTADYDLAYEMKFHKYLHKAVFKQVKAVETDEYIKRACAPAVTEHEIDFEALADDFREHRRRMYARALGHANRHDENSFPSQVWFVISERFGKFGMVLMYDNVRNLVKLRESYSFE